VKTAIVSDLHLGALTGNDLALRPDAFERLVEAVRDADRLVLLGDTLELRERPLAGVLGMARGFFERLGAALAGRRLTIVAGNHDHPLAEPWLARRRLAGEPLGAVNEWAVARGPESGPAGVIASWLPGVEVTLAYPGLEPAPGVYATHGHYVDLVMTVPRIESIAASAVARVTGRDGRSGSADDFEAVLGPLCSFYASLAEGAPAATLARGSNVSRVVWSRATGDGGVGRVLLGRLTIPAAVAALNRLGLGPFSAELTGAELRRAGLRAMDRVAGALAPQAEHVVFGHTHRAGPLPGDLEAEWATLSGARLWNCGTWYRDRAFVGEHDEGNPYWPGTVVWLEPGREPRLENALRG
jgi:hypothetical protein